MKKKNVLIVLILFAIVFLAIGGFFFYKKFLFKKSDVVSKNFDISWNVKLNLWLVSPFLPKFETELHTKGALAYTKDWLKERLKIDDLNFKINSNWKTLVYTNIKDLDLIQILWKKWWYIKSVSLSWKDLEKENKQIQKLLKKYFSNGKYLYIDDKLLYKDKDVAKLLLKNEIIKDFIYGLMTPNYQEYWKQKKLEERIKNLLISESTLKGFLTKNWQNYKINEKVCNDYLDFIRWGVKLFFYLNGANKIFINWLSEDIDKLSKATHMFRCKRIIENINKNLNISLESKNNENIYTFSFKIEGKNVDIKFHYVKWLLKYIKVIFPDNLGYIDFDERGILNAKFKYEESQNPFVNIDINIENRKWYAKLFVLNKESLKNGYLSGYFNFDENYISGNVVGKDDFNNSDFKFAIDYSNDKLNLFKFYTKFWKNWLEDIHYKPGYLKFVFKSKKDDIDLVVLYKDWKWYGKLVSKYLRWKALFTYRNNIFDLKGIFKYDDDINEWSLNLEKVIFNTKTKEFSFKGDLNIEEVKVNMEGSYKDWNIDINVVWYNDWVKVGDIIIKWKATKKQWNVDFVVKSLNNEIAKWNILYSYTDKYNYQIISDVNINVGTMPLKFNLSLENAYKNWDYLNRGDVSFIWNKIINWLIKWKITKWHLTIKEPKNYEYLKDDQVSYFLLFKNLPKFTLNNGKNSTDFLKNNKYLAWVMVWWWILAAALVPKLNKVQSRARDTARRSHLMQLGVALNVYFSDHWEYPLQVWKYYTVDKLSKYLLPNYIRTIPKDSSGKSYYYIPLIRHWVKNGGSILAAQMENSKYCNIDVSSIEELFNLVKENNFEVEKIEKLLNRGWNIKKEGCFYVIIY